MLLIFVLLLCVPVVYLVQNRTEKTGSGNATISEVTIPDEDPNISEDEAIESVLKRIKGADYDNILEFSQSYEEGGWIYEGTIQGKKVVYAYQIDGDTGELLMWVPQKS